MIPTLTAARIGAVLYHAWAVSVLAATTALVAVVASGGMLAVLTTDAMGGDLERGSLAVLRPVEGWEIRVGDAVWFLDTTQGRLVIHRVAEVDRRDDRVWLRTRGDNRALPNPRLVPIEQVVGEVTSSVGHLGTVLEHAVPPVGTIVLGVVPAVAIAAHALVERRRTAAARSVPAG